MRAFVVNEYGAGASFEETALPKPVATPGNVVIAVKATSLNPVDHKILTADVGINPELPAVLHMDVAGVIEEVGAAVDNFKIGDEVYGCAGGLQGAAGKIDGALSEFMLADASLLAHKPKSVGFREAAALPLVSITAWEALFDRANIHAGDNLLIHGGTGGVGHIAVQFAHNHGATVTTTVSSEEKAKLARSFGAENIVNYRQEEVEDYVQRLTNGKGFDVVFDTVGGKTLDHSLIAAKSGGQVVSIIGMNTHDLTQMHVKGLSLHLVFMLLPMLTGGGRAHHGKILTQVAELVDSGKLQPLLDQQTFTFEQATEAHQYFADSKHVGKIVLTQN
jgi:NADPH2:quinone reductase